MKTRRSRNRGDAATVGPDASTERRGYNIGQGYGTTSPALCEIINPLFSPSMHRDHQRWYSHRLSRDMGVAIYGNYGAPILAFPTSMGDENEQEGQGMIRTLSPY